MTEFHDPELERMLGRASGAYPDANVAFEAMRGRVRQVKRRRAMVASTATCALLVGVVALAVRGGDDAQVLPAHPDTSSVEVVQTTETTETTDVTTPNTEAAPDTSAVGTSIDTMAGASGSPGGPGPNAGKGNRNSRTTTTTTTTTTATTPAPQVQPTTPAIAVQTFASKGGSVGVQLVNGRMVLVGASPASGFTAHLNEVSGDRIRVEFTNDTSTFEVQLELSNGSIKNSSQNKGP